MEGKIQMTITDLKKLLDEQKKLAAQWMATYDFCCDKGDKIRQDMSKVNYPEEFMILKKYLYEK